MSSSIPICCPCGNPATFSMCTLALLPIYASHRWPWGSLILTISYFVVAFLSFLKNISTRTIFPMALRNVQQGKLHQEEQFLTPPQPKLACLKIP